MPTLGDDQSDPLAHQLTSFILLVQMYRPFDDAFTASWNKARGHLSAQYLSGLQKQLNDLVPSYSCQDASFHDVRANQSWLKNTVWQLTNRVVNPSSEDGLTFQYPVDMSRELLMNLASQFPGQGMELMSSGLIEKLIEMAYSMTELLSLQPASRDPFTAGPREYLSQILSIVAMARTADYRFLPLLLSKVTENLPRLANPMLQNAPENVNMANMDIFDGFGNAGMAQPPPQLQMAMDHDYDRKYSVEEYEKKYAMDMNGSDAGSKGHSNPSPTIHQHASQQPDMGSSFVASPGIMTPTVEYPPSINTFACTPMSEMVMSPLATTHAQQNPLSNVHHQPQSQQQILNHDSMPHMAMMSRNSFTRPPPASRQTSFHIPSSQHAHAHQQGMRTIGDFHGLQDMDFSTLR